MKARILTAVLALGLLPGCRGCEKAQVPVTVQEKVVPTVAPVAELPKPATPPYAGPSSKARDGFQVSTGFLNATGKAIPQPQAGQKNFIYTTALDPAAHPIGQLGQLGAAEMWGFLVARDLRHALVARADAAVREGADARALAFNPPEGGDHALVVVFRTVAGDLHAVIAPVSVAGNLPQLQGPGFTRLSQTDNLDDGSQWKLVTEPSTPVVGVPLELKILGPDRRAGKPGAFIEPLVVLVDPPMGQAFALGRGEGKLAVRWEEPQPGDWLVLVPAPDASRALMFKLTIPEKK